MVQNQPRLGKQPTRMRLNRFLARAGVAARRKSDELIQAGVVSVNNVRVADAGRVVDVRTDKVQFEGRSVKLPRSFEYVLVNKPVGCLVTRTDTHGRPTVFDRVNGLRPGTVAVGRLDQDSSGVLLLTDDGDLAHRLMHPRFEIDKRYIVTITGSPSSAKIARLRRGVALEDGISSPAKVRVHAQQSTDRGARLEICIHEGRKRQVRRMVEAVGHPATALKRVEFAGVTLGQLRPGESRPLRPGEVKKLRSLVGL